MAVAEDGHTFSPLLRGQEREVGNLYAEVPAMARKGKAQFDDLFAAGRAHSDDDSHQPALECFGSAYVMARELHYRLGEAMALEQAALVYSTLGDQSRALEMLSAAVRLFEMASDGGGLVTSLLNLGEVHTQLEQMEKAAEVLARGRAAASRLHCPELELAAIVKGAIVELRQHHPSEAIRLLGQALGIAVALGDAREEVFIASIVSPTPRIHHCPSSLSIPFWLHRSESFSDWLRRTARSQRSAYVLSAAVEAQRRAHWNYQKT